MIEQIESDLNKSSAQEFKALVDAIVMNLSLEKDENGIITVV